MAKKKLLNEAQVRRFMGLAGIQPLNEMGYKMEEDEMEENIYEQEEEAVGAEEADLDAGAEMPPEPPAEEPMPEPEEAEEEVSVTKDTIDAAGDAVMDLLGQLGYDGAAAPEAEIPETEPELEPESDEIADEEEAIGAEEPEEEEEVMEALSGVDLALNEDELVQEVARRVAKRILKAKKAQADLNEALGVKNTSTKK
jgi:hypothetical protein